MKFSKETINKHFVPKDLYEGRLLTKKSNRSEYVQRNRLNRPVFDAMVCTDEEVIWRGDLELQSDCDKLQTIAEELNATLYIVPFESAKSSQFYDGILKHNVWKSKPIKNY